MLARKWLNANISCCLLEANLTLIFSLMALQWPIHHLFSGWSIRKRWNKNYGPQQYNIWVFHLELHQRKMAALWIRSIPLTLQNHFQIMNSEFCIHMIIFDSYLCRLTRDIMTIWIFVSCRVISNQLYNSDHIVYWHFGYSCNNQRNTASCKHCRESVPPPRRSTVVIHSTWKSV